MQAGYLLVPSAIDACCGNERRHDTQCNGCVCPRSESKLERASRQSGPDERVRDEWAHTRGPGKSWQVERDREVVNCSQAGRLSLLSLLLFTRRVAPHW